MNIIIKNLNVWLYKPKTKKLAITSRLNVSSKGLQKTMNELSTSQSLTKAGAPVYNNRLEFSSNPIDETTLNSLLQITVTDYSLVGNVVTFSNVNYSVNDGAFEANTDLIKAKLSCLNLGAYVFSYATNLQECDLPLCVFIADSCFAGFEKLNYLNIPLCVNLGGDEGDNVVFDSFAPQNALLLNAHNSLETNNGGLPDGDLSYLIDNHPSLTLNYI